MKNTLLLLIMAFIALSCEDNEIPQSQVHSKNLSINVEFKPLDLLPYSAKLAFANQYIDVVHSRKVYIETTGGNKKLVSTLEFNTIGKDTIEVSELTRSTDYNVYVEYIVDGSASISKPFTFKTPQTAPDNKNIYDNLHGVILTPEVRLIEGNEFSIFSYGGLNNDTQVEFVDIYEKDKSYPATFRVVSENEIICTVPTNMFNDSDSDEFEYDYSCYILLNGTYIAPYSKNIYFKNGVFRIYNNAPRIKWRMLLEDKTKYGFWGNFYDVPTAKVKNYLNLQIVPDSYNLCIEQDGSKRIYESDFCVLAKKGSSSDPSILHNMDAFSFDKSLIRKAGKVTVWLEFHFGKTAVSTNKFTFTHE